MRITNATRNYKDYLPSITWLDESMFIPEIDKILEQNPDLEREKVTELLAEFQAAKLEEIAKNYPDGGA